MTTYPVEGYLEIPLTGAALFAGGEIANVANPEGKPLIIQDVKIYIDTATTDAGTTLSVGITTTLTASTNLINALAIDGAIAGLAYHGMTALAANGAAVVWGAAQYLTATGSAASTAFVGRLFVKYIAVR